jgi:hypothetical protein
MRILEGAWLLAALRVALLAALPFGSAGAAGPAGAADGDLGQLMAMLAMRQHGHVQFIEQQFLAVLDHPLESSGDMRYDAPDRLEKRTLAPRAETLTLAGDVLTVDRGKSHRVVDLQAFPQARVLIESIRATLAGDRAALEGLFKLAFAGSLAKWSLTLVPQDAKVRRTVAQVRIDGAQDQLLRVEIHQADGDRSLMTLRPSAEP